MSDVSLAYHDVHAQYAESLAAELRMQGCRAFAGPRRLPGFESYTTSVSYAKKSNAANILLLGLAFYREHRNILEAFADAIKSDQVNIQIVSMDSDWKRVKDPLLEFFTAISYFQEPRSGQPARDPSELISSILNSTVNSSARGVSHLTRERLLHILRGSYDTISEGIEANEQGGRIAFSEVNCQHRTSGENERYLAIYPKASLEATADFIKYQYPGMLNDRSHLFIVRSEPGHDLSLRQREFTERIFGGKAIRFESMVSGRRLRPAQPPKLTDDREFVIPQRWVAAADQANEVSTDKLFELCMQSTATEAQRRIMILNGAGGAGKTHFVRFLNDRLIDSGKDVFFLSAASIQGDLRENTIASLYDIYKISCASEDTRSDIGREVFDVKFFVDSPIIIVDGLEEIITMMGDRLSLDRFYADCVDKISGEANGKIIITNRESATPPQIANYATTYTLQLFDLSQASAFFDRVFLSDGERNQLAKKIYSEMVNNSGTAPPLFCNLIASELRKAASLERISGRLKNGEFRTASGIDEFIRTIISRETKLGVEWPVEHTLNALGELAMQSSVGPIGFERAKTILEGAFGDNLFVDVGDAVRNFFFLDFDVRTNSLLFRYDFLRTIFLAKHVVKCIANADIDIGADASMVDVLSRQLTPGSDVQSRITREEGLAKTQEFIDVLEMMIQDIAKGKVRFKSEKSGRVIASNLLFLRLALAPSRSDATDNRRIIERIFGDESNPRVLARVSMLYYAQDPRQTFRFDVCGKILRGCVFIGMPIDDSFEADDQTVFTACKMARCLSDYRSKNATIWTAKFEDSCEVDEELAASLRDIKSGMAASAAKKTSELGRFFRLFAAGHNFTRVRKRETLEGMFSGRLGISTDDIIQVLMREHVLEIAPTGIGRQYRIAPDHRLEVRHFVMDGVCSSLIDSVIAGL